MTAAMAERTERTTLGQRLVVLRRLRRLTQRELAERVGVASQTISNWERDASHIPSSDVPRVAEILGVSVAELYGEAARPPADDTYNVSGRVEDVRTEGSKRLPIYRWGSLGDPRDHDSAPSPDREDYPPLGREGLVGPNGFGVEVRGNSMVGRDVRDGDVVWINPDRSYRIGDLVLALVDSGNGDSGMVVKTYARTEVGECLLSDSDEGRNPVICREYKIVGRVVWIERGFPPR